MQEIAIYEQLCPSDVPEKAIQPTAAGNNNHDRACKTGHICTKCTCLEDHTYLGCFYGKDVL